MTNHLMAIIIFVKTCNKLLKKKAIPCQFVFDKLNITSLSKEFSNILQLEITLFSRRVLLKKRP